LVGAADPLPALKAANSVVGRDLNRSKGRPFLNKKGNPDAAFKFESFKQREYYLLNQNCSINCYMRKFRPSPH